MATTMEGSTSPVAGNTAPTLILELKGKSEETAYAEGLSHPELLRVSIPSGNSSIALCSKETEYPESGASTPRRLGSFVFPRVSSSASIKGGFASPPPSPRAGPATPVHGESMNSVKVRVGIEKQMEQLETLNNIVANMNVFWRQESHWRCIPLMIRAFLDTEADIPTMEASVKSYPICRINLGRKEGKEDSINRALVLAKSMCVTNKGFTTLPFIVKDIDNDQPKADDRILFDKLLARDCAISSMIHHLVLKLFVPYDMITRFPDQKSEILASTPTVALDEVRRDLCFLWPTFRVVRLSVLHTALAVLNTKSVASIPPSPSPEEDEGLMMKGRRRHSRQPSIGSIFTRTPSALSMSSIASTATARTPGSTPNTSVTNSPVITPVPSPEMKRRMPLRLLTPSSSESHRMTTPKPSPRMGARESSSSSLSSVASTMMVPLSSPTHAKARTSVFTGPPRLIPLEQSIILGGDKPTKEEKTVKLPQPTKRTCHCKHHHEVPVVKQYF